MADSKRIMISLPESLLKEVDYIVSMEETNRSEFVREAMKLYIREKNKVKLREKMKKGYQEMASINLTLAEVGLSLDVSSLEDYEAEIAECE
ncbi:MULTISPECIES: CopG family ribbon-helix-helix protein [Clostridium]|uniref:Transcriptional regulator, CopG family n=2 Tax=Clostridium TaxID=1485 RepID=A0A0D8IB77_9CLOT|nr:MULTISPECIES: ribbon-helix-helix protein, CopG family [Clostridium]AKL96763.1 transcriptional regulator, CopG family [Clostridium aceticum]AOY74837.1 CopG family transcriptional regulator [Clostridium formicaceticum]ARE89234.1 Antitoxin EndoAI [Clostridium formicaceticum]KJF27523.1 CopG family transcriptional regulator [Clostridium aceticum]